MSWLPASPRLRRILLAYTVNELGTWFGYVALAIGVFDNTHSALATAGLFVSAALLPACFAPALVARLEASRRRGRLSALYLAEGLTTIALAILLTHFQLVAIFVLVAIDATAALAAKSLLRAAAARGEDPLRDALDRPRVGNVDAETARTLEARKANAALNIGYTATVAAGPAIAGVVVTTLGGPAALYIDAGSFLLCGALLVGLRPYVEQLGDASVRSRLVLAWEHLSSARLLRTVLLTEALAMVFFTSALPPEVLFAKVSLHAGDSGFGLLLAMWGVGMVVGGVVFARSVQRPLGPLLTAGTFAVGLAYVGFAAAPTLLLACLAAVLGGVGNGVQWPSLISIVQRLTPPALHGRLMSTVESMGALFPAIGFALGGAIAALSSPREALLIAGIGAIGSTGVFLRLSWRGLSEHVPAPREPDGAAAAIGDHAMQDLLQRSPQLPQTAQTVPNPREHLKNDA
jgi:MFS family permease